MNFIKTAIWGVDPREQHRKLKAILRKNQRQLDKSLRELAALKGKTQVLIKKSAKTNDVKTVRIYAKELYQINKQYDRIYTSKAQLQSVGMKIEEAFHMNKMQQTMAQSAGLMREVNSLVSVPQLRSTMMELEKELLRSGIVSEMVNDSLENIDMTVDDEEVDEQVEQIVMQYTGAKFNAVDNVPETQLERQDALEEVVPEEDIKDEADNMLREMRERLNALQG
ncbi:ABR049Cp [Eremothecium gossypii ATCC 10895]|uniref:ABR049Cp n=1 Tax=Eremothecium gossypii (strain ATCC 10895 / CBS 109.51 / FGSC 9923 / NRRL Y-1056) TaxID=284811 RepID=Q75DH6_EREGS|nr:ABR049Cp [Eremothecium gossypii ATCC 10895]AAS50819.2 ABR049Cp [Eremothecium gossypii ATCC 10895]AEY95108.1 FABR049Cp [Eremothecium gossypii FDAG1]